MRVDEIGIHKLSQKYTLSGVSVTQTATADTLYQTMYRDVPFSGNLFSEYLIDVQNNEEIKIDPKKALQERYGQISFSVGDTSNFAYWERNDFPVSKLFMDNINTDELNTWRPENISALPTGFEDSIQMDVNKIPFGSRSIVIHPRIQSKMDQDPTYAREIYMKINEYLQKDIFINESILPGCTLGISQFISIGEDGAIDKTCTITQSTEKRRDNPTVQKKTKMPNTNLLIDIKNTYGEKYFDAGKLYKSSNW